MFQPRPLCFEDRTRRRTFAMYRILVAVLLYMSAVSTAPQDSNVTFVKIEPLINNVTSLQNTTIETSAENLPLAVPSNITFENNEFIRLDRNDDLATEFDSETTTEIADANEEEVTTIPTTTTTRPPKPKITQSPRFLSKLSHFKAKTNSINTVSTNSINSFAAATKVDRPYKRKFKSRCRCEKIENCPKLQITVPRCPNDYFLCCF
ncbi:uncharacterized protein LOC126775729 [Nymphalis io]|uniref:uncharacterized protein LOC126775729 n=1 Tax=Inachis io TaxID=171585 RepID=UPI002166F90A|nr:uncharacterized protein LOC126775729 [Nymphalis io]